MEYLSHMDGERPAEGDNSVNPKEPLLMPIAASRLVRVSHYLRRRICPKTPSERVQSGLMVRDVTQRSTKLTIDHSSMLDYIEGMSNKLPPSQTEGDIYGSIWMTNVYEETLGVIAAPSISDDIPSLIDALKTECSFTPFQMRKWMNDVTEVQLGNMIRIIAESNLPLKYSWTEEELLHEIFLATGARASSLDDITAARFDADAAKGKYAEHPSLRGDFRLLAVAGKNSEGTDTNYFEVHIEPDTKRGNALTYRLDHIQNACNLDEALRKYKYTIDYCSGKGASQEIKYSKSI